MRLVAILFRKSEYKRLEIRMAGKKKRAKRSGGKIDDLTIAVRELSKGNVKNAVKLARVAYRRDPSEPVASLLKRALLRRTQELYARKMPEPARSILAELNAFTVDDPCDVDELRRLNVLLGVGNVQSNANTLADDPALLSQLVDTAVRDGETVGCPQDLVPEVRHVRQALQAVADGNDDESATLLQTIGRSSPLVDWKLLIRGLIAFYDGDADRRDANWSRLDPERMAWRIAQSLRSVTPTSSPQRGIDDIGSHRLKAARDAFDTPLAKALRRLQTALQEGTRWSSIFSNLMNQFGQSDSDILERVAVILAAKFIRETDYREFKRLRKMNPPFRLDPQMTRATALLYQLDGDIDVAIQTWERYILDLGKCDSLIESQRNTAIALVYLHLARLGVAEACELGSYGDPYRSQHWGEPIEEQIEAYWEYADKNFSNSREYDPGNKEAYREHCHMLDDWLKTERASSLYREFTARFEDDFDAQVEAALHYRLRESDPGRAQRYTLQAEKLRPRDPQVAQLYWDCAFDLARIAARQKQFGVAHAELDQAEQYVGPGRQLYVLNAMRAAVELKAGNRQKADRCQERASAQTELAPAATLAYCACAFQCGVGNQIRSELNAELKAATSFRPNSLAGGAMARFMNSLSEADVAYHGSKTHEKLVATYLKKCPKKVWAESDLVDAVLFAASRKTTQDILKRLSQIGCKRFPKNPHFYMGMGQSEMSRGPRHCNRRKAIGYFETTLELNKQAETYSLDKETLESASQSLALLEMPPGVPAFRGLRRPPGEDLGEFGNFDGLPPEVLAILDELGASPAELMESVASGESAAEFIERHR